MDPVISHLLAGVAGLVVGIAGAWLMLRSGKSSSADAEKQLDEYRRQVAEHFARTSKLVDGMTDSYKAVFDELQEGAHSLLPPEQLRELMADQSEEVITLSRLSYRPVPAEAAAGAGKASADAKVASRKPAKADPDPSAPPVGRDKEKAAAKDAPLSDGKGV